jgi:hypothetical protein
MLQAVAKLCEMQFCPDEIPKLPVNRVRRPAIGGKNLLSAIFASKSGT